MPDDRPASPAFQFYPKDFLSDEKQVRMSLPAVGIYMRLICHCWNEGTLPADPTSLARMSGATKRQLADLWPSIAPCFRTNEDGRLFHPRLEREREKQATYRQRQSDKGKASATMRASLAAVQIPTVVEPRLTSGCPPVDIRLQPKPNSSSSSSSASAICKERETHADEEWLAFQAAYPAHRREGGYVSQQGFLAVCAEIGFPTLIARLEQQKRTEDWKKGMVPAMANYFLRQLWRQEPVTADDQQNDQIAAARKHMQDTADRKAEGRR